jgi:DNA polymerase I-like protein with 3'-5' exonuclease and polymerase domains
MEKPQTYKTVVIDWECSTYNKGNVYDERNEAVCFGVKEDDSPANVLWNFFGINWINSCDLLIAFNAKFDVAWCRRNGIWPIKPRVWCVQIAEFLLNGQTNRYPSLEETCIKYGLGNKQDKVKTDYWEKGYQTRDVPGPLLAEYCRRDCELAFLCYRAQHAQFKLRPGLYRLFNLMCQDLMVLQEMEWNGQKYDIELCKIRSGEVKEEIEEIKQQLSLVYPDISINFNSGDQLSAFLFGGPIFYETTELVGQYKNGKPKFKKVEKQHVLPRLVEPLPNSALQKEGYFKTDAETLGKLKGPAAKKFVAPLLRLSELEKLNSTYYEGLHDKNIENHWPEGMIHGQFNQVVAGTGRLSSNNPNLQNFSGDCLDLFVTRYE